MLVAGTVSFLQPEVGTLQPLGQGLRRGQVLSLPFVGIDLYSHGHGKPCIQRRVQDLPGGLVKSVCLFLCGQLRFACLMVFWLFARR